MSFVVGSGFYFISVLGSLLLLLQFLLLVCPPPLHGAGIEHILRTSIPIFCCWAVLPAQLSQHTTFHIQPATTQTSMNTSTLRTEKRRNPKPTTMLQVSMQWVGGKEISIFIASAGRMMMHRGWDSTARSSCGTDYSRSSPESTFLLT